MGTRANEIFELDENDPEDIDLTPLICGHYKGEDCKNYIYLPPPPYSSFRCLFYPIHSPSRCPSCLSYLLTLSMPILSYSIHR